MSKAFDSVCHDMLLQRILNLGVSPAVHEWFKSYLTDRWQYVRIGTTSSTPVALSFGIPQGSVLSPFLFNIYTDSLSSAPKSCNLESYVDDSKAFQSFTLMNMEHSLSHIEEDLYRVFEWCCNNSLLVSPEKTKMLVVGTRKLMSRLESPVHINFVGENLTPVTEVKDLGMLLDSHLTYDKHIQALSSSYISKLGQIGRVKHNFDQSTLATIIDTLVMSKINYCSSIWSNTSDSNIKKIQLIQNCAARLITGVSNRHTRKNGDLDIPKFRTSIGQRSFKYRGTKIWNELETELKSTSDLKNFRMKLRSILIEKAINCLTFLNLNHM